MKSRDRIFVKGFEMLEKEIHIINILKQLRVLKGITKETMTKGQWESAYVKYGLKSVDKDEEKLNKSGG